MGLPYHIGRLMDQKSAKVMFDRSPIHQVNKIKTPTILCLGTQDVRVPPNSGMNYYRMLQSHNVPTR